ncbi:hypothetical protein Tco_0420826 [Tanacetum coccineum]
MSSAQVISSLPLISCLVPWMNELARDCQGVMWRDKVNVPFRFSTWIKFSKSMLHVPPENNEFEGEIIPCSDFRHIPTLRLVVYNIWQERNHRIFRGEKSDSNALITKINESIRLKLMNISVKDSNAVRIVAETWGIQFKNLKK